MIKKNICFTTLRVYHDHILVVYLFRDHLILIDVNGLFFWISGEKVTMGITTLLSMTVFMMLVAENMPPTSDVLPLIGNYHQ